MKRVLSLLLALAMVLSMAACGGNDTGDTPDTPLNTPAETPDTQQPSETVPPEESYYPVTITNYDYEGNAVEYTYEKAPERVICVYQCCIEIMAALGLEEHVLASYGLDNEVKDEWKASVSKMNYDESVFAPDKETVTLLDPDMIFSWICNVRLWKPAWSRKGCSAGSLCILSRFSPCSFYCRCRFWRQ